jgi:hypothetical protein
VRITARLRGLSVVDGQHDLQRLHELGQMMEEPGALAQRLAHQSDMHPLEVAKPAVDHLRGRRGGLRPASALFVEHDAVPAARQLPGDAAAVDAAADYGDVVHSVGSMPEKR